MFGAFRLSPAASDDPDTDFIKQVDVALYSRLGTSGIPRFSACDRCRARKLRCNGQTTGCERCKSIGTPCTYSRTPPQIKGARPPSRRAGPARRRQSSTPRGDKATIVDDAITKPEALTPVSERTRSSSHANEARADDQMTNVDTDTARPSPAPILGEDIAAVGMFGSGSGAGPDMELLPHHDEDFMLDAHRFVDFGAIGLDDEDTLGNDGNTPLCLPQVVEAFPEDDIVDCSSLSFDIGANKMLQMENSLTGYSSNTSPGRAGVATTCACSQPLGPLLTELDRRMILPPSPNAKNLNSLLAWEKDACARASSVLRCRSCSASPDNMMLFTIACDKLVTLTRQLVNRYFLSSKSGGHDSNNHVSNNADDSALFVGDYEVNDPAEQASILRQLIGFQVENVRALVKDAKTSVGAGGTSPSYAQRVLLHNMELQAAELVEGMKTSSRVVRAVIGTCVTM